MSIAESVVRFGPTVLLGSVIALVGAFEWAAPRYSFSLETRPTLARAELNEAGVFKRQLLGFFVAVLGIGVTTAATVLGGLITTGVALGGFVFVKKRLQR